jgi:hypothetical protein
MNHKKIHGQLSPLLVTGGTAGFVILLILTMNWLALRRQRLTANVEIAAPLITAAQTKTATVHQALPDGEVERTAIRVREVSAVVMGLTLCAVQEGLERRPVSQVEPLLERFVSRGLLPPGIESSSSNGVLVSSFAQLYVRYRPDPLGVEIVSLPRGQRDGATIIARIITGESETAELFMARSGKVVLPAPFTPTAEITTRNWSLEPWREGNLTEPELEKINTWVRTQRTP